MVLWSAVHNPPCGQEVVLQDSGAGGAWVPQQQREGRGVGGINPVDSSTVRCWGDEKPQRPSNTTKQAPWLWV